MANIMDLDAASNIVLRRIDEIIPGDKIACAVLGYTDTVISVRVIEHTTTQDEIEVTTDATGWARTITRYASHKVRVQL